MSFVRESSVWWDGPREAKIPDPDDEVLDDLTLLVPDINYANNKNNTDANVN